MGFAPGDIQLLSNHTIVHGRTGFEDHEDARAKRHLLRLWLSLPERASLGLRARKEVSRAKVIGRLVRTRLAHRKRR
jgi:hypothetical protein